MAICPATGAAHQSVRLHFLLGASLGIVPCRARFVGRFVAFSTFVSTTSGLFFGQAGALLGAGPLVPYLIGAWAGYSLAGVIFWKGEVKRALKFVQNYPRLMEHALLSSGDHGESQTFKYERDTDLTTWIRADGCSRWLRTARMSWLVLAAQKVAPSVQQIEDARRDKLVQADIEGQ